VAREGIALPGFDRALAAVVWPHLENARREDWPEPGAGPAVIAVELDSGIDVADRQGRPRRLTFRADRVDRWEGRRSGLQFTDYKTGRRGIAERDSKKAEALHEGVRSGTWLQAAAYALSRGAEGDRGRYLFLHPELLGPDPPRVAAIAAADAELAATFEQTVSTLFEAWDRGALFPRVIQPDEDKEPDRCGYCEVAEACVRGDSGARARLRDWARGRLEGEPSPDSPEEAAFLETWLLPMPAERKRR
jgi:PD-(D/E)XK nuclease superfamily